MINSSNLTNSLTETNGISKIIQKLLDAGIDINATQKSNKTALHFTAAEIASYTSGTSSQAVHPRLD